MPTNTVTNSPATRTVIALCFAILLCEGYDLAMFGSVVPSLRAYAPWALSAETIGYMASATVLGMLLGALAAAGYADRIGRRPVVIVGVSLFSVGMLGCALAPNPGTFLAFRLVIGLGAGAVMPTAAATLIEFAPPGRRNRVTALGFIGVGVGGAAAGLLSLWLVPTFGFRSMFLVGALPIVVIVPFLFRLLPESIAFQLTHGRLEQATVSARRYGLDLALMQREVQLETETAADRPTENRFRAVLGEGRALGTVLFWVSTFMVLLLAFALVSWLPDIMASAGYGTSISLASLIAQQGGAVIGVLIAAAIADQVGQKKVVVATFFLGAVAFILLTTKPAAGVALMLIAVMGLGTTGLQILMNAYVGNYYPVRVRATGLGLNLSIGRLGGVLGPTLLGYLVTAGLGFEARLLTMAAIAVIGGAVVSFVPHRPLEDLDHSLAVESGTASSGVRSH